MTLLTEKKKIQNDGPGNHLKINNSNNKNLEQRMGTEIVPENYFPTEVYSKPTNN